MTTVGKIAIGAAVVIGGVVVYKLVSERGDTAVRDAAAQTRTPNASSVSGFLNLATSVFNYFGKQQPQPQAVPGSRNAWDGTLDLGLPLLPGTKPYEDSTRNDYLLS